MPGFRVDGSRLSVTIVRGTVGCRTADRVLRAFLSGRGNLPGPANGPSCEQTWTLDCWSCGHGAGGGA